MRDEQTQGLVFTLAIIISIGLFCFGYSLGKHAGYDQALQDMPTVTNPNIDQQCVKWLFDNNLKEARQRMCGRKM